MGFLVCNGREKVQSRIGLTDDQFVCMVTQLSHVGWSALVLTWSAILGPKYFYWSWGAWTLLTAWKEFWFDFNVFTWSDGYEDITQSGGPWGDVLDFSMYSVGALAAFGALKLVGMV